MAAGFSNAVKQPGFLTLVAVAAIGWILAIWSVSTSATQEAELTERIRQLETSQAATVTQFEELRQTAGTAESLQSQVATARADLEQIRQQQAQAQRELAAARESLGDFERRRTEAAKALDDVTANRDRVAAELQQAQQRASELLQQLTGLADQLTERRTELIEVERRLAASRSGSTRQGAARALRETGSTGISQNLNAALPDKEAQQAYRCHESESGWVCMSME